MTLLNLDSPLFLKKRLICACLRCFSLLIMLLESVMQCVVLLFCCVFIIADCRISKKQACSAGSLLAGGRYSVTLREANVNFFENERPADEQADFSFLCTLYLCIIFMCVLMSTFWWWLTLCLKTKTNTGHSALRTMWLSAPVLAYVPVDLSHWLCVPPNRISHSWACGIALADWYVGNVVLVAMGRYGCS